MPYSKDVRCGHGWFDSNVNCFYDYLDSRGEELIVRDDFSLEEDLNSSLNHPQQIKYHDTCLSEEIEERVNQFISWFVFGERWKPLDEEDCLPENFPEDVYGYVYHHVCRLVKRKPTWYFLRTVAT